MVGCGTAGRRGEQRLPGLSSILATRFGVVRGSPASEPDNGFLFAAERTGGTSNFRSSAGAVPTSGWTYVAVTYYAANATNSPPSNLNGAAVPMQTSGPQGTRYPDRVATRSSSRRRKFAASSRIK